MSRAIVIGGGPNGLIAAAMLAKKGLSCTVFEATNQCGGVARSSSFSPGFHSPGLLHDTSLFDPRVIDALSLQEHGLKLNKSVDRVLLRPHQPPHTLSENTGLASWVDSLQPVIASLYSGPSPDLVGTITPKSLLKPGLAALKAGRAQVLEWTRLMPQCAEDTLSEWEDNPNNRALWLLPSLLGTRMAPLSPSSTATLALYWSQSGAQRASSPAAIVKALNKACDAANVERITEQPVSQIVVENGRAVGVATPSGTHRAEWIVSTVDVAQTGLNLLPAGTLPASVESRLTHIRSRGQLAKIHFAVSGDCPWLHGPPTPGRHFQIGAHPLDLERAFDAACLGQLPDSPVLDMTLPSDGCTDFAPPGHHVLSVLVYAVPTAQSEIWQDATANERLLRRVKAKIAEVWPNFEEQCVASEVLNPADLSEQFRLPGGHLYHAEWALDQLWAFRPTGALARDRILIDGLLLAGAGTHGGGGLRGTAGFLAVQSHF